MFSLILRSIFASLISFFSLETVILNRNLIWGTVIFLFIFFIIINIPLLRIKIYSKRINFVTFPLVFLLSSVGFFVFVPGDILKQIYIGLASILLGLLLFYIGNFAFGNVVVAKSYKHYSLFDIIIFVCAFLSFSAIFGFYLFLGWPVWVLMIMTLVLSILLAYYYFWYNQIRFRMALLYLLVFGLVAIELTWSLSFWPTGFVARGVVMFVAFYVFSGLIKHYYQKTLNLKIIREYIIVSLIVLGLVLGTTQWTF